MGKLIGGHCGLGSRVLLEESMEPEAGSSLTWGLGLGSLVGGTPMNPGRGRGSQTLAEAGIGKMYEYSHPLSHIYARLWTHRSLC